MFNITLFARLYMMIQDMPPLLTQSKLKTFSFNAFYMRYIVHTIFCSNTAVTYMYIRFEEVRCLNHAKLTLSCHIGLLPTASPQTHTNLPATPCITVVRDGSVRSIHLKTAV